MGVYQQEYWLNTGGGRGRQERRSGSYSYYLPTKLNSLEVSLDADVVSDVAQAETAVLRLNLEAKNLHDTESIARLLLRAEAVSSSYIEGLQIGPRRMLEAEFNQQSEKMFSYDVTAAEVVGNIHALNEALKSAEQSPQISVQTFLAIHEKLLEHTPIARFGGVLRTTQNWVGGNGYNPLSAKYVPPAPEYVAELLDDLAHYCNRVDVSAIQQAAFAHAQLEAIHPFVDGNGRMGRALIHLILKKRGLASTYVPPISLALAKSSKSYVGGLRDFCFSDSEEQKQIHQKLNNWLSFFAGSCVESCGQAWEFENLIRTLTQQWRNQLGSIRANSALDLLIDKLPGAPVLSIDSASKALGRSPRAVTPAIERCLEAGIINPVRAIKRNRVFEAPEVFELFSKIEKAIYIKI